MKLTRITKKDAKELFSQGRAIFVAPCKVEPNPCMVFTTRISNISYCFDAIVNRITHCHCNYQNGYYPAFYIDEN